MSTMRSSCPASSARFASSAASDFFASSLPARVLARARDLAAERVDPLEEERHVDVAAGHRLHLGLRDALAEALPVLLDVIDVGRLAAPGPRAIACSR